jgi:hypothetical protein
MAENEIIKHTKKALSIFQSTSMDLRYKAQEIFIEIVIIVFAVSISIWFHNWSESRHDRMEEREFLTGMKQDLQADIDNMQGSQEFYVSSVQGIRYYLKSAQGVPMQRDSVMQYADVFFGSKSMDPHISRYEALKSSGKFKIVQNKELLDNIIDFHEAVVERIKTLNEKYYEQRVRLETAMEKYVVLSKVGSIANAEEVLSKSDVRLLLETNAGLIINNITGVHDRGIKKCREIMYQIDEELKR